MTAPVEPASGGPGPSAERISNLDALRGIAVLGILLMNVVSFGLPEAAYFNLDAAGSDTMLDWAIGMFGEIVADQKMMGLFSMLFGAGIVLFADRAAAKGRHPVWLSLWRNLLLLVIGVVHTMLWEGDILTVYALSAPVILLFRHAGARLLMSVGTVVFLLPVVGAFAVQATIPADGEGLGSYWFVAGGAMSDEVGALLLLDFFCRAIGMMLLGVGLYRVGVIQGSASTSAYRWIAVAGLAIGLPLTVAGVVWQAVDDYSPDVALIGQVPNTLATIPLTLAMLALVTLWNRRPESGAHLRVRAAGRMALTNYLSQTVLAVFVLRVVFDVDEPSRAALAIFVLALWAVQLGWSKPWLDHFWFGPAEWLWRCGTYRRWQAFRRVASDTVVTVGNGSET